MCPPPFLPPPFFVMTKWASAMDLWPRPLRCAKVEKSKIQRKLKAPQTTELNIRPRVAANHIPLLYNAKKKKTTTFGLVFFFLSRRLDETLVGHRRYRLSFPTEVWRRSTLLTSVRPPRSPTLGYTDFQNKSQTKPNWSEQRRESIRRKLNLTNLLNMQFSFFQNTYKNRFIVRNIFSFFNFFRNL